MFGNKFDIRPSVNGDRVVGFTHVDELKTLGWLDGPKISTYLMGDDKTHHTQYLGLINLFNTSHKKPMNFMIDLLKNSAVLEVNEGQSISYDLPVDTQMSQCQTAEDTSNQIERPGQDEGYFKIVLTSEYTKGDVLTYDPMYGEQVVVSDQHEVERRGENFLHYVQLATNDREAYFPVEMLKPGIAYMKVGHAMPEYGTDFSEITLAKDPGATLKMEYYLSSPRGVSVSYTRKASMMPAAGLTQYVDSARERAVGALDKMGGDSRGIMFASKVGSDGVQQPYMVGYTLEYLMLMELAMMETYSLLFAKAYTLKSSNGVKMVNEGLFHSMRRGKIIKYPRPGGITLNDLSEASQYIFRNSDMEIKDRVVEFKAGWMAYQNVLQLFREHALTQANGLPAILIGYDQQKSGPVFTGPLDDLQMEYIAITGVVLPGVGRVRIKHDPSMDYMPFTDRLNQGFYGEGMSHNSWSLFIHDAMDPQYSNVEDVKGAKLVEGGSRTSNIYYVKPKGPHVTWGYEQGRMADGDQHANVRSSMPHMGRELWGITQSSALLLDTTRCVIIELQGIGNNRFF